MSEAPHEAAESGATTAFAYIDADGRLGPAELRLKPLAAGWSLVGAASWTAYIVYTDHGRNDRCASFSGQSSTWSPIAIDFQGVVAGGDIVLEVTGSARDDATGVVDALHWSGRNTIRGHNPEPSQVKARLGDLPLQVVAYKESRFQQFGADGLPKFGPPHGFGVMQMDSAGAPATTAQIWDWKQNCDDGRGVLNAARATIEQHYRNLVAAHPTLPAMTPAQIKPAAYQYYNCGNVGFYWVPNADFSGWDKNVATYTAYGDDAVRIEAAVAAGTPPSDWGN
jgi:hypothetical protein